MPTFPKPRFVCTKCTPAIDRSMLTAQGAKAAMFKHFDETGHRGRVVLEELERHAQPYGRKDNTLRG